MYLYLKKPVVFLLTLTLLGSFTLAMTALPVLAANIVVNSNADTTADDGVCTLREAIIAANTDTVSGATAGECAAGSGIDTITVPGGTYNIGAIYNVTQDVTINGAGKGVTIIDAGNGRHHFTVSSGITLNLSGVTLQNGLGGGAGSIVADNATLLVSNSAVISNSAANDGGAVSGGNATLVFTNTDFINNKATGAADAGAIDVFGAGSSLAITGGVFQNNQAAGNAGAIFISSVTTESFTISGTQFISNTAGAFGGALDTRGAVTVTNSDFISNTASSQGGAIYSTAALTISGSTLEDNRASGTTEGTGGSAIWATSSLVMDNTDVLSNYAGRDYTVRAGGPVTVTNSLFQNNEVGDDGGALYSYTSGALYLADSDFIENVGYGGQCIVVTYVGGEITGTQFLRNTLANGTGTLCAVGTGDVAITNSQFISNTVSASGGGIYAATAGGAVTVSNSDFISNTAGNTGGGIYAIGVTSGLTVTNSTFTGNTSTSFGGAIENSGTLNVTNSTFDSNTSTNESGSAIFNDGASAVLQVENSTFMHNTVVNEWSTIENFGGTALITNSTFYSNTAYGAAGFAANGGTSTLVNNTFSDNANTNTNPYTVYGTPAGTLNLYNNIIANTVTGIDCGGTLATNTANLIEDGTCSTGATDLVTGDPNLGTLEYTGLGGTGILPLLGTGAMDRGDLASCPATDQRGVARPVVGCDIGAVEGGAAYYLPIIFKNGAP